MEAERIRLANQDLSNIKRALKNQDSVKKKTNCSIKKELFEDFSIKKNLGLFAREKYFPDLPNFGNLGYTDLRLLKARVIRSAGIDLFIKRFSDNPKEEKFGINIKISGSLEIGFPEFNFEYLENKKFPEVLNLINFFYDKKGLYVKVYEFLFENRKRLEALLGELSVTNLLSLFSANWKLENIVDFEVKSKSIDKSLIFKHSSYQDVSNKQKHIGTFYKTVETSSFEEKNPVKSIQLLLNKKNELTIDLVLDDALTMLDNYTSLTNKNLDKILNDEKYEKIIEENLNGWLKTIVCLASCATGVHEEITPKILTKNF
jgi:hypothetical protein